MDPNAALDNIIEAALEGDGQALLLAAHDLAGWLIAGGFAPSDPRIDNAALATG